MAYNRRLDARRDRNENELVGALLRLGGYWVQAEPVDGWAGYAGRWVPVEIKLPERKGKSDEYTAVQREFMADCQHKWLPYQVWYSTQDVEDWVKSMSRQRLA